MVEADSDQPRLQIYRDEFLSLSAPPRIAIHGGECHNPELHMSRHNYFLCLLVCFLKRKSAVGQ